MFPSINVKFSLQLPDNPLPEQYKTLEAFNL